MDRWPYSFIEMRPDVTEGDLVEVHNANGATLAMAYPTPTARRGETFMLFGSPNGTQGNGISEATNELVIPNCKQTWAGQPAGEVWNRLRPVVDARLGVPATWAFRERCCALSI